MARCPTLATIVIVSAVVVGVAVPLQAGDGNPPSAHPATENRSEEAELTLRWSTATEFERHGYHVYRGATAEGPFERLTADVIPAAGTTDVPQHYRFTDRSAVPGVTYYYYVESVSTRGIRSRLTPIRPFEAGKKRNQQGERAGERD